MTADRVGGVWQYATELAGALAPLGVETVVAVMGPPSSITVRAEPVQAPDPGAGARAGSVAGPSTSSGRTEFGDRVSVEIIDTPLPLDWLCASPEPVRAAAAALADLARAVGADIVQLNSPAFAAAARWPVPVVAVEHGSVAPWWDAAHPGEPLPAQFGWHAAMVRDGLLAADAAVAPSASYADAVRRRYGLPRAPVAIPNGRTPSPLSSAAPASHAFTAGRLWDRVKRTPLLDRVAALTPIRAAGPVTASHGETVACDRLQLLGTLDGSALAAELAGRPVFVSAASFEPFGLAVLEAAQAGCPLVLSDIATFRELWDGVAVFVAGDGPADWADAIARARTGRETLGEAARTRAARYTPGATAAAMMGVYRTLLDQRVAA
ncbi:MAG: glycosyltransferase family 4 protein [Janthinobacterium lividum]